MCVRRCTYLDVLECGEGEQESIAEENKVMVLHIHIQ